MGACGVNERDQRAFGAWPRLFVDEANAARLELRQRCPDVVDPKRDVMNARSPLLQIPRDWRIGRGRFQKLESGLPDRKKMRPHAFGRHLLRRMAVPDVRVLEGQREPRLEVVPRLTAAGHPSHVVVLHPLYKTEDSRRSPETSQPIDMALEPRNPSWDWLEADCFSLCLGVSTADCRRAAEFHFGDKTRCNGWLRNPP